MRNITLRPIIISIQPKWSRLIHSGSKTIELRRRFPLLPAGTIAFLYESSPTRSLTSLFRLGAVHELPIDDLWRVHGGASRVDETHFAQYFDSRPTGYGIEIVDYRRLPKALPLSELRSKFAFTAPQSWAYAPLKLVDSLDFQP